jgi:hypothetical protein
MGYPGEQGQSGGRHPSTPPPENTPYNTNDPYSFSPAQGAGSAYEGGFDAPFTEPYEGQEGAGYGDSASQEPNPYAPGGLTSQNPASQNMPSQNPAPQNLPPQRPPASGGRRNSLSAQPPSAFEPQNGYGEAPGGYGEAPGGYGDTPGGYGDTPGGGYGEAPSGGYGDTPGGYGEAAGGYSEAAGGYGEAPGGGYGEAPGGGYGEAPGGGYGEATGSPGAFGGQEPPNSSGRRGRTSAFGVQPPAGSDPYGSQEAEGYDPYRPQGGDHFGSPVPDGFGGHEGGGYGQQGADGFAPRETEGYSTPGGGAFGGLGSDGMGPYEPSSFEIQPKGQAMNGSFSAEGADDQSYGRHSSNGSAGNSPWSSDAFGPGSGAGGPEQGSDRFGTQGSDGFGAQEASGFGGGGFGPYEPGDVGAQSTNGHGPRHAGAFGAEEPPWATQDPDGDPYTFRSAASTDQAETHAWNEHPNGGGPVESFSFQSGQPGSPSPGEFQQGDFQHDGPHQDAFQQGSFQGGMGSYDQTTFDQTTFDQQAYDQQAYDGGPYGPGGDHSSPEYGPPSGYGPQGGFGGPGPSGEFGQPPGYGGGPSGGGGSGPGGRKKLLLMGGAAAGAVVILAGAIFLLTSGGGSTKKAAAGTPSQSQSSNAPSSSPQPTRTPYIDPNAPLDVKLKSRTTDPDPLTTDEVFKNPSFSGYTMVTSSASTDCSKEVAGSDLKAALKKGKCTQLLRATYKTTDGKLIGTIGIANLNTVASAKSAEKAGAERTSWLIPLPGGSGATKKIGGSTAIARGTAQAEGHYLVMTWVQRPDGKAFASNQTTAISNFVTQVPLGSNLDNALQYRGISGKPYGT